jgi:hypothetical protein
MSLTVSIVCPPLVVRSKPVKVPEALQLFVMTLVLIVMPCSVRLLPSLS